MHLPDCAKKQYAIAYVMLFSICVSAQTGGDSILGVWYTERCEAAFNFSCSAQVYKASLTSPKKPDLLDSHNPVDSLRTRKLNGQTTIYGLTYDFKKKRWVNGKVYNPQDGRTYSCYCWLMDGGERMFFRGYIGISFLGGSQIWTRAKYDENQKATVNGDTLTKK